ncbi:hypothetical protein HN51_053807 [Arachis hypogaea]|uniref:Uncharacterized protein n=1 Tax=Arachis hypogaea TaxID=3818 RepID=A0A444XDL7_ARAHY|nr:uncharacterized protein DS421_19g642100 [Arachis hypogaea]RYQ87697.1 hypothetical protein Ahy_B09g095228 [Arachis hypogaea]RYR40396.1 hypothetical protein Ahy_A09g046151 [Arachis hypogaea]
MSSNNYSSNNSGKQNTKGAVNSSGFTFGKGNNSMFCNCVKLPGGALCGVLCLWQQVSGCFKSCLAIVKIPSCFTCCPCPCCCCFAKS